MELIIILLFISLFLMMYNSKEHFCGNGYVELYDSKNLVSKCCPNTGDFTLVTYGKKKDKLSCCQNYKKTINKKDKSKYLELPEKGGFCTSTI